MDSIGAKSDDVMRVSSADKTSSCYTGRAENTMEPRVYSAQQLKAEIAALLCMVQYYVTPDGIGVEGSCKLIDKLRQLSAV
jgi:hypothetical protein